MYIHHIFNESYRFWELFMENIIDALQLPKDLCLGALNIRLIGKYDAYIENYKNIIQYESDIIKLQGKNCRVKISGSNMKIVCFSKDDMKIKGNICEIKYY